jgi:hypothetical protein
MNMSMDCHGQNNTCVCILFVKPIGAYDIDVTGNFKQRNG